MPDASATHDRFFRHVFSRRAAAVELMRAHLPADIVALLHLDSLEITTGSVVDTDQSSHIADLVYRVGLRGGGEAIVYVLLEHKSAPDPLVALQLLRYTTRLWDHHLRQGADPPLPPVVPLVFYHGRRRWKVATELSALLDPPEELKPFVPRFRWRRVLAPFSVHSPASKTPTCGGKWPSRACITF